jgi:transcriptional regulator with XRE-family HTH domain
MYENFQKSIDRLGITAYKVSKETGISTVTFTNWKNGLYTPKLDKMKSIANYLGVTTDYLYGKVDDPKQTVDEKKPLDFTYTDALNKVIDYMANKEGIEISPNQRTKLREDISEMGELAFIRFQKNKHQ